MAAVKTSPPHSSASSASSPEATTAEQAQFPTQKRKGGRKPVYATQEERKMRNRAAQAAFRERRTEYIKHLEATIKHHEETLSSLQQSSRNAADEVLMLRYKNSLLERILLEKGIDVTAELRAFAQYDDTGRPQAAPQQTMPQSLSRQQPIQQHPALRPIHGGPIIPKRPSINPPPEALYIKTSPLLRPNHSRTTSPSIAIPTPPDQSFQIPHSAVTTPTAPQDFPHPGIPMGQNFYPSPFQSHMEELGKLPREYDAELLESNNDDTQSLDNEGQRTPNTPVNDMGNCMGMPQQQPQQHQQGIFSNVRGFEYSLDSISTISDSVTDKSDMDYASVRYGYQ